MVWEAEILRSIQTLRTLLLDNVMMFFSMLGYKGLCSIALGLILLIFVKTRKTGMEVLLSIAIAFILANLLIKPLVMRPRPCEVYPFLEAVLPQPHDSSFPSGHTVNAFAAATAVFLNHKKVGVVALIIAALVAFSRMYTAMHFPTDVLAGIVIGVGTAVFVHYVISPALMKLREKKRESDHS